YQNHGIPNHRTLAQCSQDGPRDSHDPESRLFIVSSHGPHRSRSYRPWRRPVILGARTARRTNSVGSTDVATTFRTEPSFLRKNRFGFEMRTNRSLTAMLDRRGKAAGIISHAASSEFDFVWGTERQLRSTKKDRRRILQAPVG